jgi:hypothetical protein
MTTRRKKTQLAKVEIRNIIHAKTKRTNAIAKTNIGTRKKSSEVKEIRRNIGAKRTRKRKRVRKTGMRDEKARNISMRHSSCIILLIPMSYIMIPPV